MKKIILHLAVFLYINLSYSQTNYVLVTGGAGYIGSHACKALKESGFTPVTYDSLLLGDPNLVKWGPLVVGDLLDFEKLDRTFEEYRPIAVLHFAGLRNVGESVKDPAIYYSTNVGGSINLLRAMKKHNVKHVVFSSSCTIYGSQETPVTEEDAGSPINPYAWSKWMVEKIIQDFSYAYDLKYVALRYFNVAGVDLESGLRRPKNSKNFLIPRALSAAIDSNSPLTVFGTDYPTEDGSAIRDYIHVKDLVHAHILALNYLQEKNENQVINLGTGTGYSVLQIIDMVRKVTQKPVAYKLAPKQEGDAAFAVANAEKATTVLKFTPKESDLFSIIQSEFKALSEPAVLALNQ